MQNAQTVCWSGRLRPTAPRPDAAKIHGDRVAESWVDIQPVSRPFRATVAVPGSKSITNRALPMAAMASGPSRLSGVLFADDTRHMIDCLRQLGVNLEINESACEISVSGSSPAFPIASADLSCGNSGTTIRFLTAICAAMPGTYRLDGIERMRQRPIGELATAIASLGGNIQFPLNPGFPPVQTSGTGLAGGQCRFSNVKSSQYISAVLMAAPLARRSVDVILEGPVTSEPYVRMTLAMMEQFGIRTSQATLDPQSPEMGRVVTIAANQPYTGRAYAIEPDASNASYYLAAAALVPGSTVVIPGLGRNSLQGDMLFADVLGQMGAHLFLDADSVRMTGTARLGGLTIDMNCIPDMVQTLAVLALFADGPTHICNVGNLRIKETDRLAALETELTKLGAQVHTTADSITIHPPVQVTPATIETYDDHRMAMAFAVAGLRVPGIRISNPACCAKTYPSFFTDFAAATASQTL